MRVSTIGRPPKEVQNTFAINEGECRVVSRLTGFRKICTIFCEHLPAAKEGDLVMFRDRPQFMVGEATILEVKSVSTSKGSRTVLAVQLNEETEEDQ